MSADQPERPSPPTDGDEILDGLVFDAEAGPFITLAQLAALVALTLAASTVAGFVLLVVHARGWAW